MITFSGYRLSPLQQSMLAEATEFVLDYYMSKRLKNSLCIDIHIVKDMYEKEKTWGDVDVDEDGERSPKYYTVRLNYSGIMSFYKTLEVLVHEMIHVKQYAKRELKHLRKPWHVSFMKTHYNTMLVPYYERPWEAEAHGLERYLTEKFLKKSQRVNSYVQRKSDVTYMQEL